MDTKALRKKIIEKVKDSLTDEVVLDIAHLIDISERTEIVLSEEQNLIIDQSLKDYENGNYVTNEVAEAEIQKWLKE